MPSSTHSTISAAPSASNASSTTTPGSTLQPESLESTLLTHLSSSPALEDLHTTLLCSLQRMGWTEKIRKLTLELLRAGRCERFDDVVEAVVASAEGRKHSALMNRAEDSDTEAYFENVDVRIPRVVVDQGVRALKEVWGEVLVLDEDGEEKGDKVDGNAEKGGKGTKGDAPITVKKEDAEDEGGGGGGDTSANTNTNAANGSPAKKGKK